MGQETRDLAKFTVSRFKNKEVLDTTKVKQWSEWEPPDPAGLALETETKHAVRVIKRTTDIFEHRNRNGKPENHETVVGQGQYFQNPVVENREQHHETFDVSTLERMQDVTFFLGDQRNQTNKRKEGDTRTHTYHSVTDWQRTTVCAVTEADMANSAADGPLEITISLLDAVSEKHVWEMF